MVRTALPHNDQIRKNIFDRLYWDSRVDDYSNINVEVGSGGNVTLSGSVPSYPSRKYAELDARSVPGVGSVENRLAVKFNDNFKIPNDNEVATNIRDIIKWNSKIDESKISVTANGGYVTLEGTVGSYYQKFRAQELTADVIGVLGIDNRITIVLTQSIADEEIAKRVETSLKNLLGFDARAITVMVNNGIVTLTGTVPDILAYQAVQNVVHFTRGVTDLHDHLLMGTEERGEQL